jgi:hypothetical protein
VGTHWANPLIEPLFALIHFLVLQSSFLTFPLCFLALLVDDIHILDLVSLVPFDFDHSTSQLALMGLVVQPLKCSTWSPFGSPPNFSPFHGFCCLPIT